jgi:hypothetical protein
MRKRLSLYESIGLLEKTLFGTEEGLDLEQLCYILGYTPIYMSKIIKIAQKKGTVMEKDGKYYYKDNFYKRFEK